MSNFEKNLRHEFKTNGYVITKDGLLSTRKELEKYIHYKIQVVKNTELLRYGLASLIIFIPSISYGNTFSSLAMDIYTIIQQAAGAIAAASFAWAGVLIMMRGEAGIYKAWNALMGLVVSVTALIVVEFLKGSLGQ